MRPAYLCLLMTASGIGLFFLLKKGDETTPLDRLPNVEPTSDALDPRLSLEERLAASRTQELPEGDSVFGLFGDIGQFEDLNAAHHENFVIATKLVNEHLERKDLREPMVSRLLAVVRDQSENYVVRDYSAQALLSVVTQLSAKRSDLVVKTLLTVAEEESSKPSTLSGTIFNGFQTVEGINAILDSPSKERLEVLKVTSSLDSARPLSTRISAVQSLTAEGFQKARTKLVTLLKDGETNPALVMALCSTFGQYGSEGDLSVLHEVVSSQTISHRAAQVAITKIQHRSSTAQSTE